MDLLTPGIGLIFWQLVGFLALLFILGKFAWRPITDALRSREESIENALAAAERAKAEMASLKSENEKLLQEARLERDKVLKEASDTAKRMIDESREEAKRQGDKMIEDAKAVIQTEKQAALADVKLQVANLSLQIAEKLLRKNLSTDKQQKELVTDFVEDLNVN